MDSLSVCSQCVFCRLVDVGSDERFSFSVQFVSYASSNGHAFVSVSVVPGCEDSSWRWTDRAVTYEAMIEVHAASYAPHARSSIGAEVRVGFTVRGGVVLR